MTRRWLVLDLAAPLMAFGGVAIDQVGPTWERPGLSMVTGLLANALGWRRGDRDAHQALQDRLVLASATMREGWRMTDAQNARLYKDERGWTTWGQVEDRGGQATEVEVTMADGALRRRSYITHRRVRDYLADAWVRCVVTLADGGAPTLDDLAGALERPARPLFLGRKPCLPSRPILKGWADGADAVAALLDAGAPSGASAQWPEGEGPEGDRHAALADLRNWDSGLHGGTRAVVESRLPDPAA